MVGNHRTRGLGRALALLAVLACHGAAGQPAQVESCVSRATLDWGDDRTRRVLLDDTDRERVQAAIVERYPVVQRSGAEPTHIALWRRPSGDWVYVSLLADPMRAGQYCFLATFSAARFGITESLLRKHFGLQGT